MHITKLFSIISKHSIYTSIVLSFSLYTTTLAHAEVELDDRDTDEILDNTVSVYSTLQALNMKKA